MVNLYISPAAERKYHLDEAKQNSKLRNQEPEKICTSYSPFNIALLSRAKPLNYEDNILRINNTNTVPALTAIIVVRSRISREEC